MPDGQLHSTSRYSTQRCHQPANQEAGLGLRHLKVALGPRTDPYRGTGAEKSGCFSYWSWCERLAWHCFVPVPSPAPDLMYRQRGTLRSGRGLTGEPTHDACSVASVVPCMDQNKNQCQPQKWEPVEVVMAGFVGKDPQGDDTSEGLRTVDLAESPIQSCQPHKIRRT